MKHAFILSLLLVMCFFSAPVAAKKVPIPTDVFGSPEGPTRPKVENLDGREVVVRIYEHWQDEPAAFEKVIVEVNGRRVGFNFDDIDDSAVVAIVGEDQKDEVIRQATGDRIYAWVYEKGLKFPLPKRDQGRQGNCRWIFLDALGNPVPNATVEIFLKAHKGPQVCIEQKLLDEQARLRTAFPVDYWMLVPPDDEARMRKGIPSRSLGSFSFVVSHPDYGVAVVEPYSQAPNQSRTIFIPLVRPGTKADERSIRGTVVDSQANPVSGASIQCVGLITQGGSWVRGKQGQTHKVLTNKQGRFWLYLPIGKDNEKIGEIIPPKSTYSIRVEPPRGFGLLPYKGQVLNGLKTTITLERAEYFRTFVFEDENGQITDPNRLRKINIIIKRRGKDELTFGYDDWKNGGVFPLGTYQAAINYGRRYEFKPLEVTTEGPEELVFESREGILYSGQVIHGLTGEPMEGAFVIDLHGVCSQENLSSITAEQWEKLHALPTNPSANGQALAPLLITPYDFTKLIRADENGWFEMKLLPSEDHSGFVVFEENYLTVEHRKYLLTPDENRCAELTLTKLFPAAKVILKPCIAPKKVEPGFKFDWIIEKNDNPDWVEGFLAACRRKSRSGIRTKFHMQVNKLQSFYVPAGLNLRIKLSSLHNLQLAPINIAETINLAQDEVLDLGSYTFEPPIKVFVKVVNSAGEPVESVSVRILLDGKLWSEAHSTDEYGVAQFDMAEYSQGEFVVEYDGGDDPNAMHLREGVAYEIGGEENAGRQFTLQISDEMLYQLFK